MMSSQLAAVEDKNTDLQASLCLRLDRRNVRPTSLSLSEVNNHPFLHLVDKVAQVDSKECVLLVFRGRRGGTEIKVEGTR